MSPRDSKVLKLTPRPPAESGGRGEGASERCRAVGETVRRMTLSVPERVLAALDVTNPDELVARLALVLEARCRGDAVPVEHLGVRPGRALSAYLEIVAAGILEDWRQGADEASAEVVLEVVALVEELRNEAMADEEHKWLRLPLDVDRFDLMAEMAHDFRSPLTSILFLSETLRNGRSGDVTELQQSQLGLIYSAALGLLGFASDIMDLARSRTDPLSEIEVPFSISEVLESVVELVRPMAEEKGLDLVVALPGRDRFVGRPLALSRAMLNLTTNALKFTNSGFVRIGIAQLPKGEVEFSVRDSGSGIPPEQLERLFDPFRRPEYRDQVEFSPGGLGLSIVRHVVESMGSTLEVETRSGWGTRFSFRLLLRPSPDL
jgi:signal transduction histidine kinase